MSDLERLLFHDTFSKREGWFKLFGNSDIWTPKYNVDLASQRDTAYKQLSHVAKSGLVSVKDFIDDPTNIFTAHEMIGSINGSTCTKFTVHYNLFGGTIVALSKQRPEEIFKKIDSLDITGCFCLTELGFGNNAVMMETTATFDEAKKEFVVNSPTVLSQKYWITNGAIHANYALVFAQTYVKNKHEGVNVFMVPIRDKNLKAYEGVEINDMGYKFGLNGVDNAALIFHNVRIPQKNMMDKYSSIDKDGNYSCSVKGINQRFFKVTERLLSGRLCIASMTLGALKTVMYYSIKYSKNRMGVSPNGKSETPIFDYQLQRNALVPIVSRALGLNMLHNYAKKVFAGYIGGSKANDHDLLIICCVDKTLVGWHAERSITIMRERSGGQGYLAANMYGEGLAGAHAALTAEGDNRVLMIKVTKDLLSIYIKNPSYFFEGQNLKIGDIKQLYCPKTLSTIFMMIQKHKLNKLLARMTELKSSGKSNYDILMKETSDEVQEFSSAYGERLAFFSCVEALGRLDKSKQAVQNYFLLFGWEIILRELSTFILEGWICPNLAKSLRIAYNDLIKVAANDMDMIIENMNVAVHAVQVPIAKDYVKYNSYANYGEVVNAKM